MNKLRSLSLILGVIYLSAIFTSCSDLLTSESKSIGSYNVNNQNFYINISGFLDQKETAIRAHKSEMRRAGKKWLRYFRNEAENAGMVCGVRYAEAFEVVKWLEL